MFVKYSCFHYYPLKGKQILIESLTLEILIFKCSTINNQVNGHVVFIRYNAFGDSIQCTSEDY